MASAFGHAAAAYSLSKIYYKKKYTRKLLWLGIISSIIPDADVISFKFGIPYGSFWGHRGFSHSFLFALLWALLLTLLFFRKEMLLSKMKISFYLFLATASHAFLDAMTSGGLGVAFFSPWDNDRYFLPWRPIKVSPIGVESFFSEWGLAVIKSEVLWIGLPCFVFILMSQSIKQGIKKYAKSN